MDKRKLKRKQRKSQSDLVSKCKISRARNKGPMIARTGDGEEYKKVLKVRSIRDSDGDEYYPYCKLSWHEGVILEGSHTCINRKCPSYRVSYLVTPNF